MISFIDILIDILFWVVIIGTILGGLIWIWTNKNWSKSKKAVLTITLAAGVLIVYLGLFLLLAGYGSSYDDSTMNSHYTFSIEMTTTSMLENLTFIVPVPGNDTLVNMAIDDSVHDFSPQQKADGWNISIIETEYGKMFKIRAKEFVPQTNTIVELDPKTDLPTGKNNRTSTMGNKEVSVTMISNHIIDTFNASKNEPILYQNSSISMIYVDYNSSSDASVEVYVNLEGWNEWWQGGGWTYNKYHDRLGTTFTGEKHGWFSVPRGLTSEGRPVPAN